MFELAMLGFGLFFAALIYLIARDTYSESGANGPPATVIFDLDEYT